MNPRARLNLPNLTRTRERRNISVLNRGKEICLNKLEIPHPLPPPGPIIPNNAILLGREGQLLVALIRGYKFVGKDRDSFPKSQNPPPSTIWHTLKFSSSTKRGPRTKSLRRQLPTHLFDQKETSPLSTTQRRHYEMVLIETNLKRYKPIMYVSNIRD